MEGEDQRPEPENEEPEDVHKGSGRPVHGAFIASSLPFI